MSLTPDTERVLADELRAALGTPFDFRTMQKQDRIEQAARAILASDWLAAHVAQRITEARTEARGCVIVERSDSDGSWEECQTHRSLIPCDGPATPAEVIDAIEETFLGQLPSKALTYCAQEDVNAGLDAMRERFGLEDGGR